MAERRGVLVLHGFTANKRTVEYLSHFLVEAGFEVETPNLRGHGTRYEDLAQVTWQDWLFDAQQAFNTLAERCDRIAVIGHSVGGLVASMLAVSEARVRALALVAPALEFANPAVKLLPLLGRVIKVWRSSGPSVADPVLKEAIRGVNYDRFPVRAFASAFQLARLVQSELGKITVPALVIHPRHDTVIPVRAATRVFAGLGSREKELIWLEKSDHEVFWDLEREAVSQRLAEFCRKNLS